MILAASPAGEGRGCAGVAGDAVAASGRHVARVSRRALRALGALARKRSVVTGVAAAAGHRRVSHRVGAKLAAVLVWQLLHCTTPVGICGGVFSPVAVVPLWQLEQLVSVGLVDIVAAGPAGEGRWPRWRDR